MLRVPDREVRYDERDSRYYRNGMLFTGVAVDVYPSGKRRAEVAYRHGLQRGVGRDWYETGLLAVEASFYSDLRHGPGREWHPSGQLAVENFHEYGVRVREREWDEAGVLVLDRHIPDDDGSAEILATMRRRYGPGPKAPGVDDPQGRRQWRDRADRAAAEAWPGPSVPPTDISHGDDGLWYHAGRPLTGSVDEPADGDRGAGRHEFRLGLLWGTSQSLRPDGTLASEAEYQQGVRHGVSSAWYPSGQREGTARYEYGVMVEQREWTDAGVLIEDYRIDPDDPENTELVALRRLPVL